MSDQCHTNPPGVTRRRLLSAALAAACLRSVPARAQGTLRIGITPVFLTSHTSLLRDWREYLAAHLGAPVEFIQRDTYREIMDGLLGGWLDFAWICGYPYVVNRRRVNLVAVPLFRGEPLYRAYFIVPAEDTATEDIAQLQGKVFAYADPDSNSGYLVPRHRLANHGHDPDRFFRKAFFTAGHRNLVEAVASGLAAGGSVDGYVWETLARFEPRATANTRVVDRSRSFGFPPLVSGPAADSAAGRKLAGVLIGMAGDKEGADLLGRLNLTGFAAASFDLYQPIAEMAADLGERNGVS